MPTNPPPCYRALPPGGAPVTTQVLARHLKPAIKALGYAVPKGSHADTTERHVRVTTGDRSLQLEAVGPDMAVSVRVGALVTTEGAACPEFASLRRWVASVPDGIVTIGADWECSGVPALTPRDLASPFPPFPAATAGTAVRVPLKRFAHALACVAPYADIDAKGYATSRVQLDRDDVGDLCLSAGGLGRYIKSGLSPADDGCLPVTVPPEWPTVLISARVADQLARILAIARKAMPSYWVPVVATLRADGHVLTVEAGDYVVSTPTTSVPLPAVRQWDDAVGCHDIHVTGDALRRALAAVPTDHAVTLTARDDTLTLQTSRGSVAVHATATVPVSCRVSLQALTDYARGLRPGATVSIRRLEAAGLVGLEGSDARVLLAEVRQ